MTLFFISYQDTEIIIINAKIIREIFIFFIPIKSKEGKKRTRRGRTFFIRNYFIRNLYLRRKGCLRNKTLFRLHSNILGTFWGNFWIFDLL